MDRLVITLSQGSYSPAFVQRINLRINALDEEISRLSSERNALQNNEAVIQDKSLQLDTLICVLSSLKNNYQSLSVFDKRVLVKILVKKIIWDGRDLHIFMDGE